MANGAQHFDLSGIRVRLHGVPDGSARRLAREWQAYAAGEPGETVLSLRVERGGEAAPSTEFRPKAMRATFAGALAVFEMPEGRAEVEQTGHGRVVLRPELGDREYFTLLNLVRAGLAWALPGRGAALVHAAGLIVDGRGFVLVGAEGAGKSTWARTGEQGGATVVSDDLVLLDRGGAGYELLGAPFRSTHRAPFRRGRWPLAALLFARQAPPPPRAATVVPLLARARLTANLPFVAEAVQHDDRIPALLDRLVGEVVCAELSFSPDPGHLELLRAWPAR